MAMLIDNHKQTVLELLKDGESFFQRIGDTEQAETVKDIRLAAEKKEAPAILFYGLYNAGKSTLINAICCADVAKVGDVPTTAKIQKISWEEYVLIDTPGINAQNAHTLTAEENINQSDLVLFVVDNSDTFDNAVVYQAVLDILKTGKALAIVINQKNVDDEEDANISVPNLPSMMKVMDKISKNMALQSARSGISLVDHSNFLGYYPVNALDALEARESSNPEFRRKREQLSGILALRTAINDRMRRSMRVYCLQTPLINLNELLQKAIKSYENTELFGEKQSAAEARKQLLASKLRMRDTLLSGGLRKIEASFEKIRSSSNGCQIEDEQKSLSEELNILLKQVADQEQAILEHDIALSNIPQEYMVTNHVSIEENDELSEILVLSSQTLPPIVVTLPTTPPIPVDLSVLIRIATALIGIYNKQRQKERDALEEARRSAEQTAAYYKWLGELREYEEKVKEVWKNSVDTLIKQCYDERGAQLNAYLENINAECDHYTQNVKTLEQLCLRVSNEMISLSTAL